MYVLAGLFAIGLGGYLVYSSDRRKSAKGLTASLRRLESGYTEFLRHRFNEKILGQSDIAVYQDEMVKEVLPVLEPHLNALISGINSNAVKNTPVQPNSDSFANVAAMIEWLNQVHVEQDAPLTQEQIEQLRASVQIAIRADLIQRKMNLESGKL
jgi:hypothetical protein